VVNEKHEKLQEEKLTHWRKNDYKLISVSVMINVLDVAIKKLEKKEKMFIGIMEITSRKNQDLLLDWVL
jgi:hypothetical protein